MESDIASDPYLGTTDNGRRPIIANSTIGHSVLYSCNAVNTAGRPEIRIRLIVIGRLTLAPPTLLRM